MRAEALIAWATNDSFSIAQCEELAKDLDAHNTMTFDLVGPKGRKPAKWLDAYYGFFQLEGVEGFLATSQFTYARDLTCENLWFPAAPDREASRIEARQGEDREDGLHRNDESAVAKPDAQPLPHRPKQ